MRRIGGEAEKKAKRKRHLYRQTLRRLGARVGIRQEAGMKLDHFHRLVLTNYGLPEDATMRDVFDFAPKVLGPNVPFHSKTS